MATYTCQKCNSPLRVDESLKHLNPASFDLLTGGPVSESQDVSSTSKSSIPSDRKAMYEKALSGSSHPIFQQGTPAARRGIAPGPAKPDGKHFPDMSFVVLTESQLQPPASAPPAPGKSGKKPKDPIVSDAPDEALSQKLEYHNRLFEILSARSDIDHPICTDCSEMLLAQFQSRLSAATKERDTFASYLKDLKTKAPSAEEVSRAREELETAKLDEEVAFQDLVKKESEKEALERELAELDEEDLRLQREEEAFWKSRNALQQEVTRLQRARDAQATALAHDEDQLARLRKTNVFNDTFSVGHDGSFGTINSLRLGRLPPHHYVEWAEINAAWGLAALLLTTVAEKLGFAFQGYKIRPMGSASRIDRVDKVSSAPDGRPKITAMELFSSGDLPIARNIVHRKFNDAMVAFLDCMAQLERFIVARANAGPGSGGGGGNGATAIAPSFQLMYAVDKDLIHGVSIRLGQSSDAQWTQACKYALTNCKLLLAHTSSVEALRSGGG